MRDTRAFVLYIQDVKCKIKLPYRPGGMAYLWTVSPVEPQSNIIPFETLCTQCIFNSVFQI